MICKGPLVVLASVGMWLYACGPEEVCHPSGQLGTCCQEDADCADLSCLKDFPGGYCTRDCSQDHACPDGGHCLELHLGQQMQTLCLMGCASGQPACREGYICHLVEEIGSPVCILGN